MLSSQIWLHMFVMKKNVVKTGRFCNSFLVEITNSLLSFHTAQAIRYSVVTNFLLDCTCPGVPCILAIFKQVMLPHLFVALCGFKYIPSYTL